MKFIWILLVSSVAWSQDYFNILLLDNFIDSSVIAGSENARYSDLWGFEFEESEYVVIGSTEGSHFIRIEDDKLEEVSFQEGAFSSQTVQHRDFKKYQNYIYGVCDEGTSSLQIFDISYLPDSVVKVYDSNVLFTICHNIYIDTAKAKLYACGPDNSGMKILDISNPEQPVLVQDFTMVDYVHDCFVRNDTAFLNAGFEGLHVYYFGGATPVQIGLLNFYPEQGYNHSGWLSNDGTDYCFIDETEGKKVKYCNLNDGIENIKVSELFGTRNAQSFVPHNVMIYDGFAFVSYYNEGFRVFDLKNSPIKEIAFYDTFPIETKYKLNGAWGVFVFPEKELILISDRQYGLFLFKFPFKAYRNVEKNTVTNAPFISSESLILFQPENNEGYTFSIYSVSGQILYEKQSFSSWINVPLSVIPGVYVYAVYDEEKVRVNSGKFTVIK